MAVEARRQRATSKWQMQQLSLPSFLSFFFLPSFPPYAAAAAAWQPFTKPQAFIPVSFAVRSFTAAARSSSCFGLSCLRALLEEENMGQYSLRTQFTFYSFHPCETRGQRPKDTQRGMEEGRRRRRGGGGGALSAAAAAAITEGFGGARKRLPSSLFPTLYRNT